MKSETSVDADRGELEVPLSVIMYKHDTDKLYPHSYDMEYERHFGSIRTKVASLLEIGIGGYEIEGTGGAGLKTWADYFPNAKIVGLDIEDKSFLNGERITTWRGDQGDPDQLEILNSTHGPFDIVIDDGSHVQSDVLMSFNTLFPLLSSGGIYVIEDLATSYWPYSMPGISQRRCGGHPNPLHGYTLMSYRANTIRLICDLIDGLHHEFWESRSPSNIQKMVKSIHVSKELAFIYK